MKHKKKWPEPEMKPEEYADRRDAALIKFIKEDDDSEIRKLMQAIGTPIPKNKKVFHGGLYKSARYCTRIPEDVKRIAWDKCCAIGMKPYIEEFEDMREDSEVKSDDR